MPSFDIVSQVDAQKLDNAVNSARKEITNRYDFKGSQTEIELNKKDYRIHIVTEDKMRLDAIENVLIQKMHKQGLDAQSLDMGKEEYAAGSMVKKDIIVRQGLDKETSKKIVKKIKDAKLKVEPAIMDEQVRVSGKKIDELQLVISSLKKENFGLPLQFVNMK